MAYGKCLCLVNVNHSCLLYTAEYCLRHVTVLVWSLVILTILINGSMVRVRVILDIKHYICQQRQQD